MRKGFRTRHASEYTGVPISTIHQWRKIGKFPEPAIKHNSRCCIWLKEQLDEWLQQQADITAKQQQG